MADQTDQTIIQSILTGNVQAYAILVNRYKDMAVMLACNILLNREDAEEAAQDAFVNAYKSLHTFQAAAKFSTWLYRIVLNASLNKKKRKKYYFKKITASMNDELPGDMDYGLAAQATTEQRKHIQLAMHGLNEKERICITLFYLHELPVEEISELTGITRSNTKVLLHRGRKNLYSQLNRYLKEEITNLM